MNKIFVTVVCGATASGKTHLAAELAEIFDGEVISADSMQIYKHLDIATAKPTAEETHGVPHHLIDFLEPKESFSVADYVELAREKIADVSSRGKMPIIAGGTGLYINSLIDNIVFDDTQADYAYRDELRRFAADNGNEALLGKLREVDYETAERLHPNNTARIIRALEVYHVSGKKMSQMQEQSRSQPSPYEPCIIAIDYEDREILYSRINKRVDMMLEAGLVNEAREFFSHNDYDTAAQAIGYKELKPYFEGEKSLDECVEHLKQETRKYAKRQLTWFRRDKRVNWIKADNSTEFEEILKKAEKIVKSYRF